MCGVNSTKSPLPVLVCAPATPPLETSPQADETVFKRVDRADLTVGTGSPPDHLLGPEQCGAHVSRPIPNGEEECLHDSYNYFRKGWGASGRYFSKTTHLENH